MNLSKESVVKIIKHPFFQGSAIAFVGAFGVNVLSYIFNVVIGRMLGVVGYGEYLALVSILYLSSVPSNVLATLVTKYVALFSSQGEDEKIKPLLILLTRYSLAFSAIFILVLTIFQNQILFNLKIHNFWSLALIGVIFAVTFPQTLLNGAFAGLQKFSSASIYAAILVIMRIVLASLFIMLGLNVNGILYSMIISTVVVIILSWISIENYIQKKKISSQVIVIKAKRFFQKLVYKQQDSENGIKINREFLVFALFSTLNSWGLGSLVQTDVILAKTFLTPFDAGLYSSLAITCKVIPFFTQPLVIVMFPQIIQRVAQKKNFLPLFAVVLGVVTAGAGFVTAIYILFPKFVITMLFGKKFIDAVPFVGMFSISQMCYALLNVFSFFFLSIGRNKTAGLVMVAAIIQAIGVFFFHQSITQIIAVSIAVLGGCVIVYSLLTLQFYFSMRKKEV